MNLVTAFLWFAIAGSPLNGGGYNLSSIGPFETKAACEQATKDISEKIAGGFLDTKFSSRAVCMPINVVVGVKQ